MHLDPAIAPVLAQFALPHSASRIEALGNAGGFSGSRLWKMLAGEAAYCLKRWPAEQDEARLRFIHATQEFAAMQVSFVPKLLRTREGDTSVLLANHRWDLSTWVPGVADFRQHPSREKLSAAMTALAQLHIAWEHFPTRMSGQSTSLGIAERLRRLDELQIALPEIERHLPRADMPLQVRGRAVIEQFRAAAPVLRNQLVAASGTLVPLQPCLRDIWHDHILFAGDVVTGVVDFGAVKIDCVACDLARLLDSLVGDDRAAFAAGLAAYRSVRELSASELSLIPIFQRSTLLLGAMNWLDWIMLQGRVFDLPRVYARLDEMLARLKGDNLPSPRFGKRGRG
jgi:homoserine kinase type II